MNRQATAPLGVRIVGCCVVAGGLTIAAAAMAQTGGGGAGAAPAAAAAGPTTIPVSSLPGETKSKFDATRDQALIDGYVTASVKNLTSTNSGAQSRGREDLIAGATGIGNVDPAFVRAYVGSLGKGISGVIGNAQAPLRTRIEAGIVVARISSRSQDPNVGLDYAKAMEPLTLQLLSDPSDIVVLWGMKAASDVVPALVKANVATALTKNAISAAVAKHDKFAPVAQEAYQALTLGYPQLVIPVNFAPAVISELQDAFAARLKAYKGPGLPLDPYSEQRVAGFLTFEAVWKQETPAQQKRTVQLIADMIQLAAQQYAFAQTRQEKDGLAQIMQIGAKALSVSLAPKAGTPLEAALTALSKFNLNVNSAQDATTHAAAMFAALQTSVQGLQPVSAVQPPATTNPSGGATASGSAAGGAAAATAAPAAGGTAAPAAATTVAPGATPTAAPTATPTAATGANAGGAPTAGPK